MNKVRITVLRKTLRSSLILDGSIPDAEIARMTEMSFDLTN